MKNKLLALGFSIAFLMGNAVYGELEADPKGPVHQLKPFVVFAAVPFRGGEKAIFLAKLPKQSSS